MEDRPNCAVPNRYRFYKLLMCQSIYRNKPNTNVTFSLINRSSNILLAELVDEGELREQLDHIRSFR